jgi:hypothetical protein
MMECGQAGPIRAFAEFANSLTKHTAQGFTDSQISSPLSTACENPVLLVDSMCPNRGENDSLWVAIFPPYFVP